MSLITENDLQNTLVETCTAAGLRVFHTSDSRKQVRVGDSHQMVGDILTRGYPDLTIGGRGNAIWAELKGDKGKLEEEHVGWLDDLPPHQAYVWQPEDLEQAMEIITRGHPGPGSSPRPCRSCWTCSREEILQRVGKRKRRKAKEEPPRGLGKGAKRNRRG